MLDIQILAKNSKHWQKKIYKKFGNPKNRRTFAFGNGNETETEKLFDNIDSDIATCEVLAIYVCLPFVIMLHKNG